MVISGAMVFREERRCSRGFCGFACSRQGHGGELQSRRRQFGKQRAKWDVVPAEDPLSGWSKHKDGAAFPVQSVKTWRSLLSCRQLQLRRSLLSRRPASSPRPIATLSSTGSLPPRKGRTGGGVRPSARTPRGRCSKVEEVVGTVGGVTVEITSDWWWRFRRGDARRGTKTFFWISIYFLLVMERKWAAEMIDRTKGPPPDVHSGHFLSFKEAKRHFFRLAKYSFIVWGQKCKKNKTENKVKKKKKAKVNLKKKLFSWPIVTQTNF